MNQQPVNSQLTIPTIEQFLSFDDRPIKFFTSKVWGHTDLEGKFVPWSFKYQEATVEEKERARKAARASGDWDNIAWTLKLISLCVLDPKINESQIDLLRKKSGKEIERLATALVGESEEDKKK